MKRSIGFAFLLLACSGLALYAPARAEQAKDDAPDPEVLARGKTIYDARCKMCHRADGKGTMEEMDLTDSIWKHGNSPEAVEKVIREGVKETGMRPITGDYTDDDIKALVKYVLVFSAAAAQADPAKPAEPPAPPVPPAPAAPPAPPPGS